MITQILKADYTDYRWYLVCGLILAINKSCQIKRFMF